MKYDVVFICHWANYYWKEAENLSLEEAEKTIEELNKKDEIFGTIHGGRGCCQHYIQPSASI